MTNRQLQVIALGAALCLTAHGLAAQGGPPAQGQGSSPEDGRVLATNPEALRAAMLPLIARDNGLVNTQKNVTQ